MKNLKPLSVQLYSLRNEAEKDFVKVLKDVAEIGYMGVEPAGFWQIPPTQLKKIVEDLGMKIYSSHSPWARSVNNLGECMELAHILGINKIICGYGPDDFKNLDTIKKTADNTNAMIEVLKRNGFTLFQHNHAWEFERIDGKLKYEIYRQLCPEVKYQLDCFWSTNLGTENPVEILKEFADDVVSIHMKDGVCSQSLKVAGEVNGLLDCKIDLLPLGTGTLPIADLIFEVPEQVDTVIVELDYCNIDMLTAIRQSYNYMIGNKLAIGRR